MSDESAALNRLAREQMKHRLLADVIVDMTVCELEGWDMMEYAKELFVEVERIAVRHEPKGSERPRFDHSCGRCGANISVFDTSCPGCGVEFDMSRPFVRYEVGQ